MSSIDVDQMVLQTPELVELHDSRVRGGRWEWDGELLLDLTEATAYFCAKTATVDAPSYDVFEVELQFVATHVDRLSCEGGAFTKMDNVYEAGVFLNQEAVDLASVVRGAGADRLELKFFSSGALVLHGQRLCCRVVTLLRKIGVWPGRLDDEGVSIIPEGA